LKKKINYVDFELITKEISMEAIQIREFGGPEVLKLENVKIDEPGIGEAKIKIKAAGVNFVDVYIRRGTYSFGKPPFIPGWEASGIVDSIGAGVTNVKPGDRVAFVHQAGAYAKETIVKADRLIHLPADLSFEQGAAFPLQGMTAQYLVHEFHKIKPGDKVLIHAAAGGMGLLLVQWAKHLGAKVFGTVSTPEKAKQAKEAGAEEVILYSKQNFAEEIKKLTDGQGVDFIIDGVGKSTFPGDLEAVKIRGNIVIFGAASGPADPIAPNALQSKSITLSGGSLHNFIQSNEEQQLRAKAVIAGLEAGWLKLHIGHVLPLAQASEAHRLLENRDSTGKIVLVT
jgi:NADPH2:quinone reductase